MSTLRVKAKDLQVGDVIVWQAQSEVCIKTPEASLLGSTVKVESRYIRCDLDKSRVGTENGHVFNPETRLNVASLGKVVGERVALAGNKDLLTIEELKPFQ